MDQLLSKKFIYALFVELISGIFVLSGKLTGAEWTVFTSVIGGIYVVGNLGDAFINTKANTPTTNTNQTPPANP